MIEDQELRELFRTESDEHLQALEEGLLELEQHPDDQETLERTFREAHSLKGAARMLGLTPIEILSHHYEDLLRSAFRRSHVLQPDEIGLLYQGLDLLRQLAREALSDAPAEVDISELLERLKQARAEAGDSTVEVAEAAARPKAKVRQKPKAKPKPEPGVEEKPDPPEVPGTQPETLLDKPYQIETIRVQTERLDALMNQAGELVVTRLRLDQRLLDLDELTELWEEWNTRYLRQQRGRGEAGESREREAHYLTQFGERLAKLQETVYEDNARLDGVTAELNDGISAIRLLPLSTLFKLFPRMVRDLASEQNKAVQLLVEGAQTAVDKRILENLKDPLMHMIRNAIDHGIESPAERQRLGKPEQGQVSLKAWQRGSKVFIEVKDDGRGLDHAAVRQAVHRHKLMSDEEFEALSDDEVQQLIFISGLSTHRMITDLSGRGVGLDVVQHNIDKLKGSIRVESEPGVGCRFILQLPTTLATLRVLIVSCHGHLYALPVDPVAAMVQLPLSDIFTVEGRDTFLYKEHPLSVVMLAELLELRSAADTGGGLSGPGSMSCIILRLGDSRLGLLVDQLLDEQEIMFKSHSKLLQRVRNVDGSTILGSGEICTVLNVNDLFRSVQRASGPARHAPRIETRDRAKVILLAEDSITTRAQEKRILEGAGYQVITAVDGQDAYNKLMSTPVDALVSDIMMPNMDGLTLVEKVRAVSRFEDLPLVLVTMLASDQDRERGMQAGADAYIAKPAFDQEIFLDTLKRLIVT